MTRVVATLSPPFLSSSTAAQGLQFRGGKLPGAENMIYFHWVERARHARAEGASGIPKHVVQQRLLLLVFKASRMRAQDENEWWTTEACSRAALE